MSDPMTAPTPGQSEALRLAIQHIEHMAAWITKQNAGYSFESLGEDMPGIRAALSATPALGMACVPVEEIGWEHWHKIVDAIKDYEWPSPNIYGDWKKSEKVSFVERVVREHTAALASQRSKP